MKGVTKAIIASERLKPAFDPMFETDDYQVTKAIIASERLKLPGSRPRDVASRVTKAIIASERLKRLVYLPDAGKI